MRFGSKKINKKGFTLVEVLVTVAILAFGIVAVYQALFVSVDAYGFYTRYFNTQDWLGEKIWELQETLTDEGVIELEEATGKIIREHKTYNWKMSVFLIEPAEGLYRVKLTLSWLEGGKTVQTSRDAYLLSPKLKKYEEPGTA